MFEYVLWNLYFGIYIFLLLTLLTFLGHEDMLDVSSVRLRRRIFFN